MVKSCFASVGVDALAKCYLSLPDARERKNLYNEVFNRWLV